MYNFTPLQLDLLKRQWYQSFTIGGRSVRGKPEHAALHQMIERGLSSVVFNGEHVVDLGCRDGGWSYYAAGANAASIYATDITPSLLMQSVVIPYVRQVMNTRIAYRIGNVMVQSDNAYDIHKAGVVLFMGLLYHLRCPFYVLSSLAKNMGMGSLLIVETAIHTDDSAEPMLYCPVFDSPYEATSCSFFNRAGLIETMKSFNFEVDERHAQHTLNHEWTDKVRRLFIVFRKTQQAQVTSETRVAELGSYWFGSFYPEEFYQ